MYNRCCSSLSAVLLRWGAHARPSVTNRKMIEQPSPRRRPDTALDEARLRQQAIGIKLRQMFDEVVNEPVPDEFLDILRRADLNQSDKD